MHYTAIVAPPADMNVILTIVNRTTDYMKELNLENIFLEVDQTRVASIV